jgi:hypothetical protein
MPAPQLPAYSDQTYLGASNKLDFNAQYFVESSTIDFLTGTTDTEINFDWVSSDPSKAFQFAGRVLIISQELWESQFQTTPPVMEDFGS